MTGLQQAALIEAAREHREAGRVAESLALLATVLQATPQNGRALHQMGLALTAAGRLDEAHAYLLQATLREPTNPDRHADLAELQEVLSRPQLAVSSHRRALLLAPSRADLLHRFGLLLMGRGSHRETERWLGRALALKRPFGEARVALGMSYHKQDRLGDAVRVFRDAVMEAPDYTPGFVALAAALEEVQAPPGQVAGVGRIAAERMPDRPAIVLPVVQYYRDIGEEDEACRFATRLIDHQMAAAERDEVGRHGIRILAPDDLVTRIGEMAHQLDLHVKMKLLGWLPPFVTVLLAPEGRVVNRAFLDCWRRYVTVIDDPALIGKLEPLKRRIAFNPVYVRAPDGRALSKNRVYHAVQAEWQRQGRAPLLDLTRGHVERGRAALRRLGMPDDAWFVCLHVRESGYLKEGASSSEAARNSDIQAYLPAIAEITRRGGWLVRLGDPSMTPLPAMANVIDYALSAERTDWMDVFLTAGCRFILCTTSGMMVVALAFGVPVAGTNFFPPGERLAFDTHLYMPKLLRERSSGRLLTFGECLTRPLAVTYDARRLNDLGLEAVDNDAEDILALTREMLERLVGAAAYDAEDQALQGRWDGLSEPLAVGGAGSRIGRGFLRRHARLFDRV